MKQLWYFLRYDLYPQPLSQRKGMLVLRYTWIIKHALAWHCAWSSYHLILLRPWGNRDTMSSFTFEKFSDCASDQYSIILLPNPCHFLSRKYRCYHYYCLVIPLRMTFQSFPSHLITLNTIMKERFIFHCLIIIPQILASLFVYNFHFYEKIEGLCFSIF